MISTYRNILRIICKASTVATANRSFVGIVLELWNVPHITSVVWPPRNIWLFLIRCARI